MHGAARKKLKRAWERAKKLANGGAKGTKRKSRGDCDAASSSRSSSRDRTLKAEENEGSAAGKEGEEEEGEAMSDPAEVEIEIAPGIWSTLPLPGTTPAWGKSQANEGPAKRRRIPFNGVETLKAEDAGTRCPLDSTIVGMGESYRHNVFEELRRMGLKEDTITGQQPKPGSGGTYIGVEPFLKRFTAKAKVRSRYRPLGYYESDLEAAAARDQVRLLLVSCKAWLGPFLIALPCLSSLARSHSNTMD